jgi:hypothetical protein
VLVDQLKQKPIGREITFFSHFLYQFIVGSFVKVTAIFPDLVKPKLPEDKWLMHLEIETYIFHINKLLVLDFLHILIEVFGMIGLLEPAHIGIFNRPPFASLRSNIFLRAK